MFRRQRDDEAPAHEIPDEQPVTSIDHLFREADTAEDRLRRAAVKILPGAVLLRDGFARELRGLAEPEEAVKKEHVLAARLANDCLLWSTTSSPSLASAKELYQESLAEVLGFIDSELASLHEWIESSRAKLGVEPDLADEIRRRLLFVRRCEDHRRNLVRGFGHMLPTFQATGHGFATTFYVANVEGWGAVAENVDPKLIPHEQVIHDLPNHLIEILDDLRRHEAELRGRATSLGLVTPRNPSPSTRRSSTFPANATLHR